MKTADPLQDADGTAPDDPMFETVLVPIRYPLTATSTQTLEYAASRVAAVPDAQLRVLHVNLLYHDIRTRAADIARAIDPIVGDFDPDVNVRRGVLLEEVIRGEATRCGADLVVLGRDARPRWRRLLSRVLWTEPDIPGYLRTHLDTTIEIADSP